MTAHEALKLYTVPTNPYEQNIHDAAVQMIANKQGHWEYSTQYASGSTVWRSGECTKLLKASST